MVCGIAQHRAGAQPPAGRLRTLPWSEGQERERSRFQGRVQIFKSRDKPQAPVAIGVHPVLSARGSLSVGQRNVPQSKLLTDGDGPGHFRGASASPEALWEGFQEEVRAELRCEGAI